MKLWHFSLSSRDGIWVSQDDTRLDTVDAASLQISHALRFGRATVPYQTADGASRDHHLQVTTVGGTLLAKLYTANERPDHTITIGVAPRHARCAKLLWEGLVENPRADVQPKRPVGSWCAYRIETVHEKPEVLDWLKTYAQNLASAWLTMVPSPAR